MNNRFNIVSSETATEEIKKSGTQLSKRQQTQARFDRLWLTNPEQFNPLRNAIGKERLRRTLELIESKTTIQGKTAVDLGCGSGIFCQYLRDAGASVDAIDISNNALKNLQETNSQGITAKQDFVPFTTLNDSSYDIVVSMELIGYLEPKEHRLYFSELARLVKDEGYVISSTAIDLGTEGAVQTFGALVETEFTIAAWKFSYNALAIHIADFLKGPERFAKAWQDPTYRKEQLAKRRNIGKYWFKLNSSKIVGSIWRALSIITRPIAHAFENSKSLMTVLEKICRPLWGESGISHIMFIGQRRPLIPPTAEELQVNVPKQKRHVWE
jgi:2-polyprenyl-3-methyl-5-hydroxy-6-metoxy-1,4-benzoquinol methylase